MRGREARAALDAAGAERGASKFVIRPMGGGQPGPSEKIPNFKDATSTELRKFAEKTGLTVVVGAKHLKVLDATGNLVTTIPNAINSPYTAKGIIEAILSAQGGGK